jgi:hypothetical protein
MRIIKCGLLLIILSLSSVDASETFNNRIINQPFKGNINLSRGRLKAITNEDCFQTGEGTEQIRICSSQRFKNISTDYQSFFNPLYKKTSNLFTENLNA